MKEPKQLRVDGRLEWRVDGKLHRLDGPAVIWADGGQSWYVDGDLHRLDGPAVIHSWGPEEWWVRGEQLPTHKVRHWLFANGFPPPNEWTDAQKVLFLRRWGGE
jgi:hypothetical protein